MGNTSVAHDRGTASQGTEGTQSRRSAGSAITSRLKGLGAALRNPLAANRRRVGRSDIRREQRWREKHPQRGALVRNFDPLGVVRDPQRESPLFGTRPDSSRGTAATAERPGRPAGHVEPAADLTGGARRIPPTDLTGKAARIPHSAPLQPEPSDREAASQRQRSMRRDGPGD